MPTVEDMVRAVAQEWTLAPASLVLFGSAARRDGDADSDIDLLLVRNDATDTDDETWAGQRHTLARDLERWTGNTVQIVDLSESELAKAVRRKEPLISGLRADGIVLAGRDPEL
jgi:predicted nucleotidyltransferase